MMRSIAAAARHSLAFVRRWLQRRFEPRNKNVNLEGVVQGT